MWQRTVKLILAVLLTVGTTGSVWAKAIVSLHSPNHELSVQVSLNSKATLVYQVKRRGDAVIQPSALGLTLANSAFADNLTLKSVSEVSAIASAYSLVHGKQRNVEYQANEVLVSVENKDDGMMLLNPYNRLPLGLSDCGLAEQTNIARQPDSDTRCQVFHLREPN